MMNKTLDFFSIYFIESISYRLMLLHNVKDLVIFEISEYSQIFPIKFYNICIKSVFNNLEHLSLLCQILYNKTNKISTFKITILNKFQNSKLNFL